MKYRSRKFAFTKLKRHVAEGQVYGNLEERERERERETVRQTELRRTASFVRATGISV